MLATQATLLLNDCDSAFKRTVVRRPSSVVKLLNQAAYLQ